MNRFIQCIVDEENERFGIKITLLLRRYINKIVMRLSNEIKAIITMQ